MKPIIYYTKEYNSLTPYYFEDYISKWFDIRLYDPSADLRDASLMLGLPYKDTLKIVSTDHLDQCRCILVDNLQEGAFSGLEFLEPWADKTLIMSGGVYTTHKPWPNFLNIPEWFWYFESPWYQSKDYHLYEPDLDSKKRLFFMPIRRSKIGRELIFAAVNDLLENAVWSFVEKGVSLPGYPDDNLDDQRWFNPDWYDSTFFSVVNEDSDDTTPLIMTEKTFKPIAFFHPFVVVSQPGLLALVRKSGFLSWPELFDESYDDIPDLRTRVEHVNQQIRKFDRDMFYAPEIQEKLKYNRNRFFDQHLIFQNLTQRLVYPVLEFIESRK